MLRPGRWALLVGVAVLLAGCGSGADENSPSGVTTSLDISPRSSTSIRLADSGPLFPEEFTPPCPAPSTTISGSTLVTDLGSFWADGLWGELRGMDAVVRGNLLNKVTSECNSSGQTVDVWTFEVERTILGHPTGDVILVLHSGDDPDASLQFTSGWWEPGTDAILYVRADKVGRNVASGRYYVNLNDFGAVFTHLDELEATLAAASEWVESETVPDVVNLAAAAFEITEPKVVGRGSWSGWDYQAVQFRFVETVGLRPNVPWMSDDKIPTAGDQIVVAIGSETLDRVMEEGTILLLVSGAWRSPSDSIFWMPIGDETGLISIGDRAEVLDGFERGFNPDGDLFSELRLLTSVDSLIESYGPLYFEAFIPEVRPAGRTGVNRAQDTVREDFDANAPVSVIADDGTTTITFSRWFSDPQDDPPKTVTVTRNGALLFEGKMRDLVVQDPGSMMWVVSSPDGSTVVTVENDNFNTQVQEYLYAAQELPDPQPGGPMWMMAADGVSVVTFSEAFTGSEPDPTLTVTVAQDGQLMIEQPVADTVVGSDSGLTIYTREGPVAHVLWASLEAAQAASSS